MFSVLRLLLYPLALVYGAIVWIRNKMYDSGMSNSVKFAPPVISVGNLSVGGTGKTPHVEYLIRLLQQKYIVATMSRGYKRNTSGFLLAEKDTNAYRIGDEPMQYFLKFPEAIVTVAEERMTGIPQLLQRKPETDVILLDDAYQHRSVKAGLNILITDYHKPYYKDHILPFGTLREGRSSYKRADIIVVSKCPPNLLIEEAQKIENQLKKQSHQHVFFSTIQYGEPYEFDGGAPASLEGTNAILVTGIARPGPMENYVKGLAREVHTLSYPDHHYFVTSDLEEIKSAYNNWDVPGKVIVTTEKDAARLHLHLDKIREWNIPVVVLPITVSILFGKETEFNSLVSAYVDHVVQENNTI
ncbi:MAG: tetraacyldisaccharide 4'-kinase [Flavipsychrobacter sp.]|nr:tetraacyldisaccharide 4'-kinase [Flavipsychrobacter sp.]